MTQEAPCRALPLRRFAGEGKLSRAKHLIRRIAHVSIVMQRDPNAIIRPNSASNPVCNILSVLHSVDPSHSSRFQTAAAA